MQEYFTAAGENSDRQMVVQFVSERSVPVFQSKPKGR